VLNAHNFSEDVSANLNALEVLHAKFNTQLLLIESGGDNLAANYRQVHKIHCVWSNEILQYDLIPTLFQIFSRELGM
jgi:urease accessory protein